MKIPDGFAKDNCSTDALQEACRPITSLISKSEKALQKLMSGTWQHRMLQDNIQALHIAHALMTQGATTANHFTRDELQGALRAYETMISRSVKARSKFPPGTSQHTLQQNRLRALRMAEALTQRELDDHSNRPGATQPPSFPRSSG